MDNAGNRTRVCNYIGKLKKPLLMCTHSEITRFVQENPNTLYSSNKCNIKINTGMKFCLILRIHHCNFIYFLFKFVILNWILHGLHVRTPLCGWLIVSSPSIHFCFCLSVRPSEISCQEHFVSPLAYFCCYFPKF